MMRAPLHRQEVETGPSCPVTWRWNRVQLRASGQFTGNEHSASAQADVSGDGGFFKEMPVLVRVPVREPQSRCPAVDDAVFRYPRRKCQISFRPSIALATVTESTYSRFPPTGMPMAIRVMLAPRGFKSLAR